MYKSYVCGGYPERTTYRWKNCCLWTKTQAYTLMFLNYIDYINNKKSAALKSLTTAFVGLRTEANKLYM